jgi:protein-S-isoprenylcysteine O-methyltransferase Ste14
MRVLELKVPPGIVALGAAALMWAVARWTPQFDFPLPARGLVAAACGAGGLGLAAAGVISFRRAKTTWNPRKPEAASALVSTGIYARTRNPMYLGVLCLLLGWACLLANALAVLVLPGFVFFLNRFQIEPEERVLAARFGREFAAYRERVQRWL